jgi:hypothetical protein
MNLTFEQVNTYNAFINRIKKTIDETLNNVHTCPMKTIKETIINNVDFWKNIQSDIFATDLPKDIKIKLSLICDDGFREYDKKLNKLLKGED